MRYSLPKTLAISASLALIGGGLLQAGLPNSLPKERGQANYQHIEQPDIYLVMSDREQLDHARGAVHKQLVTPLLPTVGVEFFGRGRPLYDPDFRPVFAQAQNGTVPFSIYKYTGAKKSDKEQKSLHLVGYYDVATGRVMVFDSRERSFIAANGAGAELKRIGFHHDPQRQPGQALVKHRATQPGVATE
ncbi:MAG: hypothetical protein AAGK14_11820 [Verrucomicrobiota bacterium]